MEATAKNSYFVICRIFFDFLHVLSSLALPLLFSILRDCLSFEKCLRPLPPHHHHHHHHHHPVTCCTVDIQSVKTGGPVGEFC